MARKKRRSDRNPSYREHLQVAKDEYGDATNAIENAREQFERGNAAGGWYQLLDAYESLVRVSTELNHYIMKASEKDLAKVEPMLDEVDSWREGIRARIEAALGTGLKATVPTLDLRREFGPQLSVLPGGRKNPTLRHAEHVAASMVLR